MRGRVIPGLIRGPSLVTRTVGSAYKLGLAPTGGETKCGDKNPEQRTRAALLLRESQQTVMFARERSTRGHMKFPSIAQQGE